MTSVQQNAVMLHNYHDVGFLSLPLSTIKQESANLLRRLKRHGPCAGLKFPKL